MLHWRPYVLAFSPLVLFQPRTISQSRDIQSECRYLFKYQTEAGKPNRTNNGVYVNSKDKPVLGLKTVQPI